MGRGLRSLVWPWFSLSDKGCLASSPLLSLYWPECQGSQKPIWMSQTRETYGTRHLSACSMGLFHALSCSLALCHHKEDCGYSRAAVHKYLGLGTKWADAKSRSESSRMGFLVTWALWSQEHFTHHLPWVHQDVLNEGWHLSDTSCYLCFLVLV